ncbi:S-layer homology domain-containing protein [Natranaerobius thermophilus]|uniref:S-layer domain protein n=1 Tax=Natranaerobius thermophilus (strain ATCC BAA-1301 / DSM 18059 / JW/NM-WN-LF) TaxID=457570 RepID=B2A851_NATTJ|nr:S-layer homology domain-containing protein [Natranaerobius thermophilus]ACB85819.1 S-layer domain protein [Natranaerobius thermophilus JW/NM-WN-LF]
MRLITVLLGATFLISSWLAPGLGETAVLKEAEPHPVIEAEQKDANLTEEEVIQLVEELIPTTQDLELERADFNDNFGRWQLGFETPQEVEDKYYSTNVYICDENKNLESFTMLMRELEVEDPKYVTHQKSEEIAREFLKRADYDLEELGEFELLTQEISPSEKVHHYGTNLSHNFTFRQLYDGYGSNNEFTVYVSSRTGEVTRFLNNYDSDLEFEEVDHVIDKDKAEDLFIQAGAELEYDIDYRNEKIDLQYSPIVGNDAKIDAETGEYLDFDGETKDLEEIKNSKPEVDLDMGALEIDRLDEPLDRRDQARLSNKVEEVVSSAFDVEGEPSQTGSGGTLRSGPLEIERVSTDYQVEDPDVVLDVNIEKNRGYLNKIDVKPMTDDPLISVGDEEYSEQLAQALTELAEDETEANFEQVAEKYLTKLTPEFLDYLDYSEATITEREEHFGDLYRVNFPMKAYGLPLNRSHIHLVLCQETGKLNNLTVNMPVFKEDIDKPEDLIDMEEALKTYLEDTEIQPFYGHEGEFYFEFINYDHDAINAITGELEGRSRAQMYTDPLEINNADNDKLIEWLHAVNVIVPEESQVIDAEKTVTKGEAARLIKSLTGEARDRVPPSGGHRGSHDTEGDVFTDVEKDHPDCAIIEDIYEQGLIPEQILAGEDGDKFKPDQNITREELATMLVKAMNLQEVAELDNMELDYQISDQEEIHNQTENHVLLTVGLDIISLKDSEFRPQESVTRNEMAQVFDRLVGLGRFVQ